MKKFILSFILMLIPLGVLADDTTNNIIDKITSQIPALSEYQTVKSSVDTNNIYIINFYRDTNNNAQANINGDGTLISYFLNSSPANKGKRLPKVSKAQASQTAIDFINTVASDIIGQLDTVIYTNTYNITSGGYNVHFTRSVNGLSYSNDSVSVWIDSETGRVTRYSRIWNDKIEFASTENIISQSEAESEYESKIGLQLRYNKRIDNGKAVPYLVYVPTNTGTINAITGDVITQKSVAATSSYSEMLAMYEKTSVTDTAIEKDNALQDGLKSGAEAQKYAREIGALKIDGNFSATQAKYYINTNGEYIITLTFNKGSDTSKVTLDAKTLEIIGFYNSETAKEKSTSPISTDKVKAITDMFLNKYLTSYINELSSPQFTVFESSDGNTCLVTYERIVNGISYKSNSAQFLVGANGDIISMSFNWDKVQFEDLSDIQNPKQAYKTFTEKVGLHLVYMKTSSNTAFPVYITNPQVSAIIAAKSGRLLSYDGKPAKPKRTLAYIGLEEHYAKLQATVLADCDIFVSEGDVLLDDHIMQKDLIVLLAAISPNGMPIYEKQGSITNEEIDLIYNDFVTKGVIDKNEINPYGYVKRENAVKYLLRTVGYKSVAELKGIFKMPFADSDKISTNLYGYVALARGLKLISGSEGNFYPGRYLTNADALVMVYNYLNR